MLNHYNSLKHEEKSVQDGNKSLLTPLKLLNNEIKGKDGRYQNIKEQNLDDEESSWVTVCYNKTMPRNNQPEKSNHWPK